MGIQKNGHEVKRLQLLSREYSMWVDCTPLERIYHKFSNFHSKAVKPCSNHNSLNCLWISTLGFICLYKTNIYLFLIFVISVKLRYFLLWVYINKKATYLTPGFHKKKLCNWPCLSSVTALVRNSPAKSKICKFTKVFLGKIIPRTFYVTTMTKFYVTDICILNQNICMVT